MTDTVLRTRTDEIEAIKQLKARYFRALDTKDWDAFRGVFVEDPQIGPIENGFPRLPAGTAAA
ncbi:nuclear transport factor 2 family protein [Salinibacterium sp. ZJ450]|uniref:nuclear transport factor 2 family protein n=1 Tax=Salinibacterium sp. ZJ450 TaxID=2708338 RepID=UPI001421C145|nr:nuclear transport factor 2 family protein [Salinibacterium sp. ZJ450]